jgi:hypothetical protein
MVGVGTVGVAPPRSVVPVDDVCQRAMGGLRQQEKEYYLKDARPWVSGLWVAYLVRLASLPSGILGNDKTVARQEAGE